MTEMAESITFYVLKFYEFYFSMGSYLTHVVFPSRALIRAAKRASKIAMKDRRKILADSIQSTRSDNDREIPLIRLAADRPKVIPNPLSLLDREDFKVDPDKKSDDEDDENVVSEDEEEKNADSADEEENLVSANEEEEGGGDGDGGDVDPPGVVVLGMHRSTTSLIAGLMTEVLGFNVGPKHLLIQPGSDNEKGFYERVDAVLQNDEFFYSQDMTWASGMELINYDYKKALSAYRAKKIPTKEGQKSLAFYNNQVNSPWLQKDPRMCITLRTWLKLFNKKPVALFSFRHPLEVAYSLKKRQKYDLSRGLKLWIVYNARAIQNSAGLCRVLSSSEKFFANPTEELKKIVDALSDCDLKPPISKDLDVKVINSFIDTKLRHNKSNDNGAVLAQHGDCVVKDFKSKDKGRELKKQKEVYLQAMNIYCDLKSGKAYEANYKWPVSSVIPKL
eukprot:CAMPEP_0194298074 /NCGR_PEP_ID=MMETSP0169-20130528/59963_1 /TAXON_ID=218684 /ORGANISM="Corethron pennatum, Strain L29A3" /LENGTH=447 /DNA_ID=CAMNT_0039048021 /DNA_START=561 /DNA_END=1904 /DNA_ORIENTATION=+